MPLSGEQLNLFQKRWREGFVLHVDGIAFPDGRIVLLDSKTMISGSIVQSVAAPLAETTLSSVLSYDPDAWVQVTQLQRLVWSSGIHVECGEGAMGNEGYVAVVGGADGALLWVLFCSRSNPFVELRRDGDVIVAVTTYDQVWRIPYLAPGKFTLESSSGP